MGGLRGQDQGKETALETEKKAWEAREDVGPCPVFLAFPMAPPICESLQFRGSSQKNVWNPGNKGTHRSHSLTSFQDWEGRRKQTVGPHHRVLSVGSLPLLKSLL